MSRWTNSIDHSLKPFNSEWPVPDFYIDWTYPYFKDDDINWEQWLLEIRWMVGSAGYSYA